MRRFYPEMLMLAVLTLTFMLILTQRPAEAPTRQVYAAAPQLETSGYDDRTRLRLLVDGQVRELTLHDYLIGVLLSELPADFAPEAMKAQAVASRTYALHCVKHEGADVCADSGCCQAWREPEAGEAYEKARAAVEATDGLVLEYDGALIDATFFSCSGGMTEDALAVWGTSVPYLQSIESPGEEQASCYRSEVQVTPEEFADKLPQAGLRGDPAAWLGEMTRTAGGGVAQLRIGDGVFTGTQLRSLFGLRSTRFELTYSGQTFVFTVCGYGHRVGLSQYGAQAMAQNGADYETILKTYYTGVELVHMEK